MSLIATVNVDKKARCKVGPEAFNPYHRKKARSVANRAKFVSLAPMKEAFEKGFGRGRFHGGRNPGG